MSNHKMSPVVRLNEVSVCDYSFYFETDGSGEVSANTTRGLFWTITKTAATTGTYTLVLNDTFRKVLQASAVVLGDNDYLAKFDGTVTQGASTSTFTLYTRTGGSKSNVATGVVNGLVRVKATIAGEGL